GGVPAPGPGSLDETASYVLDELEGAPGQLDSPSQISQGTVSLTGSLEETVAGVQAPRRTDQRQPEPTASQPVRPWQLIAIVAAVVAAVLAIAWRLDLF
ncbi:MAG TPA: hypothetical protein VHK01_17230, partial [Lacipirellulaceae bacterium]|nr:hypothetical protein [Lacipirellulaceae bacterium]